MINKKRFEEIICDPKPLAERLDDVWDELCSLSDDVAIMKDYDQCNPYHCYDLRMHTVYTVDNIDPKGLSDDEFRLLKIAAFFHDLGKPATMTMVRDEQGRILKKSFGGHPQVSRDLAEPILRRLGYQKDLEMLRFYISCHDMFMHFVKPEKVPEGSRLAINTHNVERQIRRYIARHKPTVISFRDFYTLTWLCEADGAAHAEYVVTAKGTDSRAEIVERMLMIRAIVKDLMEKDDSIASINREVNFRELGGYPMDEDRKIIPGIFFRSGQLSELTPEEMKTVENLGIRTILDFRSEYERSRKPDPEIPEAVYQHVPAFIDKDGKELDLSPEGIEKATGAQSSAFSAEGMHAFLQYMYGGLVFNSRAYQEMFDAILEERVPMLIHCTAGKDRTGVGSMLILLALGTDSRVLRKDYMMTNAYRWTAVQRFLDKNRALFAEHPEAEEALVAYEGVREEAIDIVLNTILSRYSSIDAYLEAEFGLDDMARMKLQEMYLE